MKAGATGGRYDAVIVGAGFSGMYMLHNLRQLGLSVRVYEVGTDVGGTWYWNRYPGARCDVESLDYSYSFSKDLEQQWQWSERYPVQPEILKYAQHVADTFDLRKDIQFETRVTSARFDDVAQCWRIQTDHGAHVLADYCIMATGCLSTWRIPEFAGREPRSGPRAVPAGSGRLANRCRGFRRPQAEPRHLRQPTRPPRTTREGGARRQEARRAADAREGAPRTAQAAVRPDHRLQARPADRAERPRTRLRDRGTQRGLGRRRHLHPDG